MEINMKRVGALIKRDWILYKRNFYIGILALGSICVLMMFMVSDEADPRLPDDVPEIIFSVMLFSVGSLFTLRSFREFKRPADAVTYIGIPASHMEKFLSRWIVTLPIFVIVCSVVFIASYSLFSIAAEQVWGVIFTPFGTFRWFFFEDIIFHYVFTHSVFLFFALCFNSNTLVKSLLVFVVAWILFVMFIYYKNNGGVQADDAFKAMIRSNQTMGMSIVILILWALSYNRLKAKTA